MRFFAAVAVVLIHVGSDFFGPPWLRALFGYGYVGVSFFFLLSGFVLTWSSSGQAPRRFWWLRFSRIWPAQALVAVLAFATIAHGPASWLGRGADLLLVQSWWPSSHVYYGGNGVSWSLSCEAFFYLLFPAFAALLLRLDRRALALAAAADLALMAAAPALGAWFGVPGHLTYWLFFILPGYRLLEFLLGMLLARAVGLGLLFSRPALAGLGGGIGVILVLVSLAWTRSSLGWQPDRPWVALMVVPLFCVLLLAGASADLRSAGSWLASRPLRWLGATSFALYLVHQPVFRITHSWGWWPARQGAEGLLAFAAFLGLVLLAAACLHHLVEKPLERRLRALPQGAGTRALRGRLGGGAAGFRLESGPPA